MELMTRCTVLRKSWFTTQGKNAMDKLLHRESTVTAHVTLSLSRERGEAREKFSNSIVSQSIHLIFLR